MSQSSRTAGRPPVTSRAELELAALELFAARGFDGVTVDDIAAAAGISRRTFFRYYPSKNDVVWGAFDDLLDEMDGWLAASPPTTPTIEAIAAAVVRFNSLPPEAIAAHRQRMALILRVPALQAHGTLRYADWRAVIARFVASRLRVDEDDPLPRLVGQVSLGIALAAYEQWLATPGGDLASLLESSFAHLLGSFASLDPVPRLVDAPSPALAERRPLLVVPIGSVEQHGPHLPLDTDTRIAVAAAEAAVATLTAEGADVVLAPALAYGSSGEHAAFAGTLSIGQEALEHQVVELVRSADRFLGVLLVNGHGGNVEALLRAVATLIAEGRNVVFWSPRVPGFDGHAGRAETSLLLHLAPDHVEMHLAVAGNTTPVGQLLPAMRAGGVGAVSPSGVLGDPTGATASEGAASFRALVADLVATAREALPT